MMIMGPAAIISFIVGYKIGMRYAHSSHSIGSLVVHCVAAFATAFVVAASAHIFDPSLYLDAATVVTFAAVGLGVLTGVGAGSTKDGEE